MTRLLNTRPLALISSFLLAPDSSQSRRNIVVT
jgi:hypothetical protein